MIDRKEVDKLLRELKNLTSRYTVGPENGLRVAHLMFEDTQRIAAALTELLDADPELTPQCERDDCNVVDCTAPLPIQLDEYRVKALVRVILAGMKSGLVSDGLQYGIDNGFFLAPLPQEEETNEGS
jgi:recombinational DNA repair protein RecR